MLLNAMIILLLLVVPFAFITTSLNTFYIKQFLLIGITSVSFLIFLLGKLRGKYNRIYFPPHLFLLVALMLYIFCVQLFIYQLHLEALIPYLSLTLLAVMVCNRRQPLPLFSGIILITVLLLESYAFLQLLSFDPFGLAHDEFLSGTLGNPHFLSAYIGGGLMLSIPYLLPLRKLTFGIYLFAVIFGIFIILQAESWGVLLLLGITTLLVGIIYSITYRYPNPRQRKQRMVLPLISLLLIIGMVIIIAQNPQPLQGRLYLNKIGLMQLYDSPIVGSGDYAVERGFLEAQGDYLESNPDVAGAWTNAKHLENEWLELAVEHGIIGLLLLLAFTAWLVIRGIQLQRRELSPLLWSTILSGFGMTLFFSLISGYSIFFSSPPLLLLFGIGIGYLLQPDEESATSQPVASSINFRGRSLIWTVSAGVLLALGIITTYVAATHFLADHHTALGKQKATLTADYQRMRKNSLVRHYSQAARTELEQALELNPQEGRAYFFLGNIHFWLGEYPQAYQAYKLSLRYFANLGTYINIGNTFLYAEDYANAEFWYDQALHLHPQYSRAYLRKALVYLGLYEATLESSAPDYTLLTKAENHLIRAQSLNPENQLGQEIQNLIDHHKTQSQAENEKQAEPNQPPEQVY